MSGGCALGLSAGSTFVYSSRMLGFIFMSLYTVPMIATSRPSTSSSTLVSVQHYLV